MRRIVEAPEARRAIVELLEWSHFRFGEDAAFRYNELLRQAYADLAAEPDRPTAARVGRRGSGLWRYHLKYSRGRIESDLRVGRPRHILVYRFDEARIDVLLVLHDRMDIKREVSRLK